MNKKEMAWEFLLLVLVWWVMSYAMQAHAADWLCTEEASQRRGNAILACGIGQGKTENSARLRAFDHAKTEFQRVCGSSSECQGRGVSAIPQRTECRKSPKQTTCYRLVRFELAGSFGSEEGGRVQKGMSKKDIVSLLGQPEKSQKDPTIYSSVEDGTVFFYRGPMCSDSPCLIHFDGSGQVSSVTDLKPEFDGVNL